MKQTIECVCVCVCIRQTDIHQPIRRNFTPSTSWRCEVEIPHEGRLIPPVSAPPRMARMLQIPRKSGRHKLVCAEALPLKGDAKRSLPLLLEVPRNKGTVPSRAAKTHCDHSSKTNQLLPRLERNLPLQQLLRKLPQLIGTRCLPWTTKLPSHKKEKTVLLFSPNEMLVGKEERMKLLLQRVVSQ